MISCTFLPDSRKMLFCRTVFQYGCWMSSLGVNSWIEWTGRWKHLVQGENHLREQVSVGSCFSTLLFQNAPGMVADFAQTCEFRRKLSRLDRAPRNRLSVLPHD